MKNIIDKYETQLFLHILYLFHINLMLENLLRIFFTRSTDGAILKNTLKCVILAMFHSYF